jgi:phosphoglycerol geranylgeranyltransferase
MTLIDPDKHPGDTAGEIARHATAAGTDAIMVGGSTGVSQPLLDATVKSIKTSTSLPIILFPTSANALSRFADAIYFMSMLNSIDLKYVIREHRKGALVIRELGLEPISMGYIVIEPGMTVGKVGHAELVSRDNIRELVGYALSAEYLGMKLVYLEAGSGAPEAVPSTMIRAVKSSISIPLVVGGGIRNASDAKRVTDAGADIIVTGSVIEVCTDVKEVLGSIIGAIKKR